MKKFRNSTGFTLVELLVVIAIIGMLIGLILPAVQGARGNAQRIKCVNNQKNIALAVQSYEGAKNEYPPLRRTQPNGWEASWAVMILPYIEEVPLYNQFMDKEKTFDVHTIALFRCASTTKEKANEITNYVANAGMQNLYNGTDITYESYPYDSGDRKNGIFFDHMAVMDNKSQCKTTTSSEYISNSDGTSKTIMFSENENAGRWLSVTKNSDGDTTQTTAWGETEIGFSFPYWEYSVDISKIGRPYTYSKSGLSTKDKLNIDDFVNSGVTGFATECDDSKLSGGMTTRTLKLNSCKAASDYYSGAIAFRYARPSSRHPGLVVAAYCDGTVRTINEDADPMVYLHAVMPNDGDPRTLP